MDKRVDVAKRISMLQKWKQSDACNALCIQEQEIYNQLLVKGCQYLRNIDLIMQDTRHNTVRVECSVKGNMHRGVYCPSPVLDLFVGGLSRGCILQKASKSSKITHKYGFDEQGHLLYVESMLLGGCTEYILRENDLILGITVDCTGNLSALSEETYLGGRLQRYTYAEIAADEEQTDCYQMYSEEYFYDNLGLNSCLRTEYIPMFHDIRKRISCTFERQAGYLHSYTVVNQIWKQIDPNGTKAITYTPAIKRKA